MDTISYREVNSFFYAVIWIAWWTGVQMGGVHFCVGFGGRSLEVKRELVFGAVNDDCCFGWKTTLDKVKRTGCVAYFRWLVNEERF